jgi:hypothetical protein
MPVPQFLQTVDVEQAFSLFCVSRRRELRFFTDPYVAGLAASVRRRNSRFTTGVGFHSFVKI